MNQRQNSSKAIQLIVLSILIPLISAGCVHTDLPAQVVPPAPVGTAKLPLKVAVLDDPSLTIHEPLGFYERLNPGLANTIRDALAVNFERVGMVDDRPSANDANLLAITTPEIQFYRQPHLKLEVLFIETDTGQTVADLSSVKPFDSGAPGVSDHAATDTILGMLPPLGILALPTIERHDSERFNAGFGPSLVAMATDIAAQASKDPAIVSLSMH